MADPAMTEHGRDPDSSGQAARATSRETLGCELAAEVLRSFGKLRLRATGASMLPAIWPGDVLEVRRQAVTDVQPGDVVLFWRRGRLVAHRVVEKLARSGRTLLVTQGDRQSAADAPVSAEDLLGRVIGVRRGNRRKLPLLTFWRRVGVWILNRSDFLTRALLHVSYIMSRRSRPEEA